MAYINKILGLLKHIFVPLLFIICFMQVNAQSWDVPDEEKDKSSPFEFNEQFTNTGEELFLKNCVSCHGNPGKGNFLTTLVPNPPDPASEKTQNQTDGELFYKISTGNGLMPSFKNIISGKDRWQLISYFRSFNDSYIQPPLAAAEKSYKITIKVIHDSLINKLAVYVTADDTIIARQTEVSVFAERYFGSLKLDSTRYTNESGEATFSLPKDLPGDKEGNIKLLIRVYSDKYGEAESGFDLKFGVPMTNPPLTEKRAMWNVVSKAPIWLLISFFGVVIGVWLFLIKMVLNILRINKLGKK